MSDDNGAPRAIVETESPAVVDWFDALFTRQQAATTPLAKADPEE